jgi:hypothetical protein
MEKIKTTLDRPSLSSGYIRSKQDFKRVELEYKKLKPPLYSRFWFYGTVGMSVIALLLCAAKITNFDAESDRSVEHKNDIAAKIKTSNPLVFEVKNQKEVE